MAGNNGHCIVLLKIILFLLGESYAFLNPFDFTNYDYTIYKSTFFIGLVAIAICLGVYDYKNALTKYHTEPLEVEEITRCLKSSQTNTSAAFLKNLGKNVSV